MRRGRRAGAHEFQIGQEANVRRHCSAEVVSDETPSKQGDVARVRQIGAQELVYRRVEVGWVAGQGESVKSAHVLPGKEEIL